MADSIRKKAQRLIAALGLSDYYDLDTLRRALEAHRGRVIVVRPANQDEIEEFLGTGTGATFQEGDTDVVIYHPRCTPRQMNITILHEFGHLIWEHQRPLIKAIDESGILHHKVQVCDLTGLRSHMHLRGDGKPLTREELEAEITADELYKRLIPTAEADAQPESLLLDNWLRY